MPTKDILPWNRSGSKLDVRKEHEPEDELMKMQNRMNSLFDEFFENPFGLRPFTRMSDQGSFFPQVDVSETDETIKVVAEVPGMEDKDISVGLSENVLTISGFKESEKEQKNTRYHRIERTSGTFRREIVLPAMVNEDKVEAIFKNGVLTVTLPKQAGESGKAKRITVKAR